MIRRDAGHTVAIVAVIIIAVVVLGLLGWIFWRNFLNPSNGSAITNFEQCKAAEGSKLQLTYPEQCVTSDGRTFTGPAKVSDTTTDKSYCSEIEKLCFTYPSNWTLTSKASDARFEGDLVYVVSSDKELTLKLETNISGIGGTCGDETTGIVVLDPTPIPKMTGYKDEYNDDMLQVARVVYPNFTNDGKSIAGLYVSTTPEYLSAGTKSVGCPPGFSYFVKGKNARISPESDSVGAFSFGYTGTADEGARYGSVKDAQDAYQTDNYKEAAAILASLHYK